MNAYDVNIDETDSVINIISKRVLPEKTVEELLNRRSINKNIYIEFRLEQIKGHKTTWDHMKKNNLPTHTVSIKITKVKLQNCVIVLKRDRKLMVCFLIASRKRSKLNPEKQIGLWEFSMVPTIRFIIFWDFSIFYQISLSPQVKRWASIYEMPHELPNDLRLRILGN